MQGRKAKFVRLDQEADKVLFVSEGVKILACNIFDHSFGNGAVHGDAALDKETLFQAKMTLAAENFHFPSLWLNFFYKKVTTALLYFMFRAFKTLAL